MRKHANSSSHHAAQTVLTMWAIGQYTMMCQIVTKMHRPLTFTLHTAHSNRWRSFSNTAQSEQYQHSYTTADQLPGFANLPQATSLTKFMEGMRK
jgi:hypothetical protein